jgi:1,4-alpha-glucan branching enzyme
VGAAGIPLMFMGTEMAQSGWWNTDQWHRLNWDNAGDDIGKGMMAAVKELHALRRRHKALAVGWSNCIHEDRANGIMG